jgi:hypothetical protein
MYMKSIRFPRDKPRKEVTILVGTVRLHLRRDPQRPGSIVVGVEAPSELRVHLTQDDGEDDPLERLLPKPHKS